MRAEDNAIVLFLLSKWLRVAFAALCPMAGELPGVCVMHSIEMIH
jgi:hypothetical protein